MKRCEWPVQENGYNWGAVISEYGQTHYGWGENGIFIAGFLGAVIVAVQPGNVVFCGWQKPLGHAIHIYSDEQQILWIYGCLLSSFVLLGQYVKSGEPIGTMGKPFTSPIPQLYLELRTSNQCKNPLNYLQL